MYQTKFITEGAHRALLHQGRWMIKENVHFEYLTISPRAELVAPEGKLLTMTVNGVVRDIKPGKYCNVQFTLSEPYVMPPHGLMQFNQVVRYMGPAICVEDGKLVPVKCIPAAVQGGTITDEEARDLYLAANAEGFNGIVIAGKSDYEIDNVRMDMEGFGDNDFIGGAAGIMAVDESHVKVCNSKITMNGVTRCAIHVGGDSVVEVNDCELMNISPSCDWPGTFSWSIGLEGTNRLCQLADNGTVTYNRCHLKSNGWALLSIDGTDEKVKMVVKDSLLELSGPSTHGYGVFCIGEKSEVIVDHTTMDVFGYPMLVMGMEEARPSIINGSVIRGRRFGAMLVGDDSSILRVENSRFETGKSCFVAKGSASVIDVKRSELMAENGVILQMMDTEENGMDMIRYFVPVGEEDEPIAGWNVTEYDSTRDVLMRLEDMYVCGDFYNSTTNIRAEQRAERQGMGEYHDTLVGLVSFSGPRGDGEDMPPVKDLNGPKNLLLEMRNTQLLGAVSSAKQRYRDGVTEITPENAIELSNVVQWASPTVNNGVIVTMDERSSWTVTETCYITALSLAEGAKLKAEDGKHLRMLVDGVEAPILPGGYQGRIQLEVTT